MEDYTPRWTVLLKAADAKDFDMPEFKVVNSHENMFSDDYTVLELELADKTDEYTCADILDLTDALAVHEEFTNAVLTTEDSIDTISDEIYCWQSSGGVFIGDMLTELERLHFLQLYVFEQYGETGLINDFTLVRRKDEDPISLELNLHILFSDDIHTIKFKDHEISPWWANIIEERGLFVVIMMDDWDEYEDYEETHYPLVPTPYRNEALRDYYDEIWGDYYDSYGWR